MVETTNGGMIQMVKWQARSEDLRTWESELARPCRVGQARSADSVQEGVPRTTSG